MQVEASNTKREYCKARGPHELANGAKGTLCELSFLLLEASSRCAGPTSYPEGVAGVCGSAGPDSRSLAVRDQKVR